MLFDGFVCGADRLDKERVVLVSHLAVVLSLGLLYLRQWSHSFLGLWLRWLFLDWLLDHNFRLGFGLLLLGTGLRVS